MIEIITLLLLVLFIQIKTKSTLKFLTFFKFNVQSTTLM
jgi:hypothetical protein